MKFQSRVEPPEPMKGLEIPPEVVESLGGGKRPPVTITLNGHVWRSRVALMRGRYLIGLSRANREAAGVETGDEVEVGLELDTEPRPVVEPEELAAALDAEPAARAAYDKLPPGRRRQHVIAVEGAKKPETRQRRVEKIVAELLDRPGS
ncbi:YdeI/OmpD-associated family protein [Streptomyces sp. MAR4 CNX-425]|uniref:YdeI/OmpD-associated family protein n=1 Tax=Streptomyces sp. MAR4 CNX-425 TaxID=3406343 RepID=UPI003B502902